MGAYLIRRILLIFPTLFGIMLINFAVIQIVPGGPVEQMIAQMTGTAVESTARFSGGGEGELNSSFDASSFDDGDSKYRGAQGLDPDIIKEIEVMYGMNKPAHERFLKMLKSYIFFDFGESFFRDQKVTSLVLDKMPVSISLMISGSRPWAPLYLESPSSKLEASKLEFSSPSPPPEKRAVDSTAVPVI